MASVSAVRIGEVSSSCVVGHGSSPPAVAGRRDGLGRLTQVHRHRKAENDSPRGEAGWEKADGSPVPAGFSGVLLLNAGSWEKCHLGRQGRGVQPSKLKGGVLGLFSLLAGFGALVDHHIKCSFVMPLGTILYPFFPHPHPVARFSDHHHPLAEVG